MTGFACYHNGRRVEIKVRDKAKAKQLACDHFGLSRNLMHIIVTVPLSKDVQPKEST